MSESINLIKNLVANGCEYASEIDGDILCFFCNSMIRYEPHDLNCLFVRAKEMITDIDVDVDDEDDGHE